ncbi:MAG TPA: polysaccharide deacetylase family protein [Gammaproteobacteria bacterium]
MNWSRSIKRRLGATLCTLVAAACGIEQPAGAADSAVILMYHHVDASTPASTSVTPERFEAHLEHLEDEGYRVRPLLDVLEALRSGQPVEDRTVVLTFDDGYSSVLDAAMPLLRSRNWPFTVFVASDYAEGNHRGYLDWDGLRELTANGATIGNHSRSHAHFVRRLRGESERQWRDRIRDEIEAAGRRLEDELGEAVIPVLAYPFGEYDTDVKGIVAELGLFALGQHSGAAGSNSDFLALPRFPVASGYDDLDGFAQRLRSKALPVELIGGEEHVVADGASLPTLRIRLLPGDYRADALACYATAQGAMDIEWLGDNFEEVAARPRASLAPGRSKYNCTAPSASENGVFYWFSYLWMNRNEDGSWYAE